MDFITWTEMDSVKVDVIDDQHKAMIAIINKLYENLTNSDKKVTERLLDELNSNLDVHFKTEEKCMLETNYHGYISHKLEHDRFFNKIQGFIDNFKKGNSSVTLELLNSFRNWFHNHLELNDKKCGEYFAEKGVSPLKLQN